jgi:hypothetical protein
VATISAPVFKVVSGLGAVLDLVENAGLVTLTLSSLPQFVVLQPEANPIATCMGLSWNSPPPVI